MDLQTALELIRNSLSENIAFTKHFVDQCIDRKLDENRIRKILLDSRILGILEQGEALYKIWFFYEKNKDLNIILRISNNEDIRLVTVFPCYSDRRRR